MNAMASQITSLTIVYSIVYSDADQREHQNSASLAFVWGIVTGEFLAQMASNAENVFIWWRHHVINTEVFHHIGVIILAQTFYNQSNSDTVVFDGASTLSFYLRLELNYFPFPRPFRSDSLSCAYLESILSGRGKENKLISHDDVICPWTKWPPFDRRYVQVHFSEWKNLCFWLKFH